MTASTETTAAILLPPLTADEDTALTTAVQRLQSLLAVVDRLAGKITAPVA